MTRAHPDPDQLHPLPAHPRVIALRPLAAGRANVTVGPFAYYDDPDHAAAFFERNVLYHYDFIGDRLEIGAFAALGTGVKIIMNGANHAMGGFSSFPFEIFGPPWDASADPAAYATGRRGDTVIGADVWIGTEAVLLPGVTIGPGAVIGARSVVSRDVPPFAVIAGNPGEVVRHRFDEATVARLMAAAWWDWPLEKITRNLSAIRGADVDALESAT